MHARISGAALTKALRCRRTVSVCAVLRRAKRGRFAYFALRLAPNHLMLCARIRRNLTHSSPDWVAASLARACWVVVCRSSPLEGMLPVGIRGNSREQRFAAYLPVEAIVDRITPEDLVHRGSWRFSRRGGELPALRDLDLVCQLMADFGLQWGPTGSVGFEIATGVPTTKMNSDLDLLIRAPSELTLDLCRRLRIRLSEKVAPRTDVLIETGTGAIALDEYVRGGMPILLRSSTGPKLVYNPWEIAHEYCFHISRTGVPGAGDASFSSESSSRHSHSG
jgi:phosphoribosyl-dephospho-CoA transferase